MFYSRIRSLIRNKDPRLIEGQLEFIVEIDFEFTCNKPFYFP